MEFGGTETGWLAGPPPRRRVASFRPLRRAGLGCAIAGFAAALGAGFLPWRYISVPETEFQTTPVAVGETASSLGDLGAAEVLTYNLSLSVLLALVAISLGARPRLGRTVMTAALGWAAGHLVVLVGIAGSLTKAPSLSGRYFDIAEFVSIGPGTYLGFAAVVLLATAVVLATRSPRPKVVEATDETADVDVTVSAVPVQRSP